MTNWLRKKTLFHTPRKAIVVEKKSDRFWFLRIIGIMVKRACTVMGAIMLIMMAVIFWSASNIVKEEPPKLPNQIVLFLRMEKSLPDKRGAQDYFSQFGLAPAPLTAAELVDALDKAATDNRVKGFVLSLRSGGYELAQLQEIRNAVLKFKKSGKFTKVYAPSYGEAGSGLGMYYLASSFDEIWMQPVGVVSIAGLNAEMPYFKDILERYGVKGQFFQRKEYKSAMENLTANEMSPASRQMMTELIGDLGDQVTAGVASDRKKVSKNFRSLVDQGLFTDDEALKAGLIDRLDYGDVLLSEIRVQLDGKEDSKKTGFTDIADYAQLSAKTHSSKSKVAVVYVQGAIMDGGGASPLSFDEKSADATEIAQAIRDAASDKNVSHIIVRVNSPGGSPSASESIRRAIVWAKEKKKKPVIVSMGSTAASGGYWISANADKIYADAATLTGSIGVVGGKFDASGLFEKYGVNWDGVSYGKNAGMWAMNRGFNAAEQERFEATLDNVYEHFIRIVAQGRKLKADQVEKIAKGRVWTGRQAKEVGLVDQIGGLDMVLDDIAKSRNVDSRHKLAVVDYPPPENPLEALLDMAKRGSPFGAELPQSLKAVAAYLPFLENERLVYTPLPQL
ncbi:MAG: signal peptide peptidase SppA [Micavibrio aeruginosavorus]|uniref:Signal peptide peptidase SppA n=1 Tax=Micavibrio aeruginosavorus TaxID=349221 RepID=A0A2W5HHP5_9BACT|nr:MAG: signal peptide peptidase SppA [Micavibrio aeruginosavorus]